MNLRSFWKLATLTVIAASPFMIASDHMPAPPCTDEQTGEPCWDITFVSTFYYNPFWVDSPLPGSCYSCIHSQRAPRWGTTFSGYVFDRNETLTCTIGTVAGTGGNRWCFTTPQSPTVLISVAQWAGTGTCNGGHGCLPM